MRVGLLLGSLNERSTNEVALHAVAHRATETGMVVAMIEGLADIPPFSSSSSAVPPGAVARFRAQLADSDVLILAAPEYAAGVAGSVKNALDWLVGSATLYEKVVGVMSAGTTGGTHAVEQLVRTLSWQGAYVVATLGIDAPQTKLTSDGRGYDERTSAAITTFTDRVIRVGAGGPDDRRHAVAEVVSPYGIDPARFGDFR